MVSWELVTSELPRHRHHGTQTCGREGKTSVLLRQVGLIADSTDERADLEHMLSFPTRSVKFNDRIRELVAGLSTNVPGRRGTIWGGDTPDHVGEESKSRPSDQVTESKRKTTISWCHLARGHLACVNDARLPGYAR